MPKKETGWIAEAKAIEVPAHVPRDAWEDFVDMRALKRSPLTRRACLIIFDKLLLYKAAGQDPRAVLYQSIERGWLTVYALKNPSAIEAEPTEAWKTRAL